MLNYLRLISLILFLVGANSIVFGQCTTGASFPTAFTNLPITTSQTFFMPQCSKSKVITTSGTTNQHSKVYVIAGYQYNFRSLSVGSAVQTDFITIARDDTGAPLFSGLNGTSGIYWTATLTGVIRFYTHTSSGCPTTSSTRSREVIMAPFQAKLSVVNSLCFGNPGTGQYTVTVGPNHGWNYTSLISPLNAFTSAPVPAAGIGSFAPRSYDIKLNGISVNGNASIATNPEICPNCPGLITNGTSTWTETAPSPPPFPGYTYISVTPIATSGTNTFTPTNTQTQTGIGTYTTFATIIGNNASNQTIAVLPSGTTTNLAAYTSGCGAYLFYPTITAPPNLLFNQSGTTNYSCGSGSVTLSANGGTAPYNISWFNQASSTIVTSPLGNEITTSGGSYPIPNLLAGTYTLTLTDANGCVKTISALIINPPPPPSTPVASVSAQPTCILATGTITVIDPFPGTGITYTVTGTAPVVAAQNNTTGVFLNLAPGIYAINTSLNGCASPVVSLIVDPQPVPPSAPLASVTEQPNCSLSTGTVTVSNPIPGAGITFSLTGINPVLASVTNTLGVFPSLSPGIYELIVSLNGCNTTPISLTVNLQPITPAAPIASVTEQTNCTLSTGTITVTDPLNGLGITYTATGTNPVLVPITNGTGIFSNLAQGIYDLTTSANGCTSPSISLTINPQPLTPLAPIANVTEQPNCLLSTGTITVSSPANAVGISYTVIGTNPIVPSQNNSTGIFSSLSSGIYNVTTSSAEGCISPATSLTVNSQPPTPVAPTASVTEQPTCTLSTGTITVSSPINAPGVSYTLTGVNPVVAAQNNFTGVFLFLNSGIYEVATTSIDGCVSPAISLIVDPQPLTPAEPIANVTEQPTCFLPSGTITVTSPANEVGISYTLTGTNPVVTSQTDLIGIFSGLSSGIYDVTTTSANGCTSLAVSLTINPQPITPPTPTIDTTAATCSSDGTAAITNYDATYSYSFNPTVPTVDASGIISNMLTGTSYTLISDNGECLSLESAPFVIDPQMITPVPPTAGVVEQPTCTLSTGTIEVSIPTNGIGIVYSVTGSNPVLPSQTNDAGVFPNLTAGIYDVTTSLNGCNSASISLEILPQPGILTSSIDTIICPNNLPFSIYSLTFTTAETQVASLTSLDGCDSLVTINLFLEPLITSLIDTTICSNNLPFSMNSLTFSAAGTQVANLIAVNGCDSLVTINLTVIANDNSNFSQISPICFGDPLALPTSSLNGFSGTWSPAIDNTDTTTYTFTPGIGQCGYTATMTIIVYPQAIVTITDTSICTGGTAILIATGSPAGGDFFWSNANPTSSITVSPTFSTSYSVFYTTLNNCFATATRLLAVNPIPTATATSALICDGEIATIVATGLPTGGTYLWSPSGQMTESINVTPSSTANYSVVYSRLGCESPAVNTVVTVNPVPILNLASEVICIGEDITMTAQTTIAGGVYDWGNGNANETQTFSPLSDTTLSLSYSVNDCTSPIETATITVNPLPISTFSGSPLTGCIPLEVTLLADDNSNTSYSWSASNGLTGTGSQSNLTFTSGGTYDITLIAGLNGCFTTTTMNNYVAVDNYPIASFVPSSNSFTELTQLLEFTNNSSGADSYSWDFGDGASSTEINPAYFFTDNLNGHVITLTAYSQFLCANVDSVEILFNNGLVYYIPNTFTPNGDEFNQTFKPIFSNSIDVYNYSFYIYNRWGHVIFETHDVEKGWDGLFGVDGIPVPQGTYTFKIIVKYTETDERKEFFGHVNVAR